MGTFRYPRAAVFAEPFAAIASTTMTAATHLLWAALWSGLAARALDTARRYAKAELPEGAATPVLTRLSDLRNRHYLLNALIRDNLPGTRPATPFLPPLKQREAMVPRKLELPRPTLRNP